MSILFTLAIAATLHMLVVDGLDRLTYLINS